jgi:mono/diheme cytochrome c family protein
MLISAIFAGGGSCDAQQVGNAGQGRRLAHAGCAQCHGVDRSSYSSNLAAPTFDDIATVPGMTSRALIVALRSIRVQASSPLPLLGLHQYGTMPWNEPGTPDLVKNATKPTKVVSSNDNL